MNVRPRYLILYRAQILAYTKQNRVWGGHSADSETENVSDWQAALNRWPVPRNTIAPP